MWKIFNKVFGWHYVEYRDTATVFVARVIKTPNGKLRMTCDWARNHYNAILAAEGKFEGRNGSWIPLTWIDENDSN